MGLGRRGRGPHPLGVLAGDQVLLFELGLALLALLGRLGGHGGAVNDGLRGLGGCPGGLEAGPVVLDEPARPAVKVARIGAAALGAGVTHDPRPL